MSDIAIRAEGLSKQYRLGKRERYRTLRDSLSDTLSAPYRRFRSRVSPEIPETFWALKDVSFDVKQGEVLGIIGRNGAGKSTLLKVLSRITEPTEGHAQMHGRVASLLEVGTGFHPELTGRDNIYLNGAILGMKKAEIRRKFDEIVAFAEVDKFIDTPVKHYSSGMYVRLAFAVAAHLEPEILVVDEVLAVGDAQFQRKCLGKMSEVASNGRTILFVSHNMSAIQQLTQRSLLLSGGMLRDLGPTPGIIAQYLELAADRDTMRYDARSLPRPNSGHLSRDVEFVAFEFLSLSHKLVEHGKELYFRVQLKGNRQVKGFRIAVAIRRLDGTTVGGCFGPTDCSIEAGQLAWFDFRIRNHSLAPGMYYCDFGTGMGTPETGHSDTDVVGEVLHFEVMPRKGEDGSIARWQWGSIIFSDIQVTRAEDCDPANPFDTGRPETSLYQPLAQ